MTAKIKPLYIKVFLVVLFTAINLQVERNFNYLPLPFILVLLLVIGMWSLLFHLDQLIIAGTQRRFPAESDFQKRLLWSALAVSITSLSILVTTDVLIQYLSFGSLEQVSINWAYQVLISVLLSVILFAFFEVLYRAEINTRLLAHKKELEKLQLQSSYEMLKAQVSPHFLFNSLNSLSALISKNPMRAEQFVDEMSTVYRYLLRSNENELSTLSEELHFIRAYGSMLKTRFDDGLQIRIHADDQLIYHKLPSLTLQLLVENAVKHNEVSEDKPLIIKIETGNDNKLCVRNNLQKKKGVVFSNKLGLKNIISRYRLLGLGNVDVTETETEFIVSLSLMA
jgi:sensor histidine kinase YesM